MSKKIKILIIGELYLPLIPWFLEEKKPQGAPAVYALYQYLGTSKKVQFTSYIYSKSKTRKKHFSNGSKIELTKFNFPNHYLWKTFVYLKLLHKVTKKLRSEHFDLVYGLSNFASIAAIAGRRTNTPSVGRIYGTILTKAVKNRSYFQLYTRFILDVLAIKYPADLVIATQDGTAYDQVFAFFNKKKSPLLLFNGIDQRLRQILLQQPPISSLPKDSEIHLAYIARLEPYKRQELAILLVENIAALSGIRVKLTILGSGSQEDRLRSMVRRKGLTHCIQFKSEIPHEELPAFLQSQHICLFFYEGGSLGNTLWECALAGKLLVTIDSGETSKFLTNGTNCISTSDESDAPLILSKKILDLLDQDITPITTASRQLATDLIKPWQERFKQEFDQIEATLL